MQTVYASRYNLDDYSNRGTRGISSRTAPGRAAASRTRSRNNRPQNSRRNPSPNRSGKRPPVRKKKGPLFTALVVGMVLVFVFLIGFVSFNMYREYRKGLPFKYSDGVTVAGIDIGGLSVKEARAKLETNAVSTVKDILIKVTARDKVKTYTKTDFKYKIDFETPLKEAKVYSLKEQGIYEAKKGVTEPDTEASTDKPEFKLKYSIKKSSIKARVKKLARAIDLEPVNAKVKKFHPFAVNRFEYKRGSYGYKLNQSKLNKTLLKFFKKGKNVLSAKAQVKELAPAITVQKLRDNIVGLSTASSVSQNTANGTHNMKVALNACNGSVIEPGDTWSFNSCTGDSNLESNGYKKAAVISEKKLKQGIGGGICQASTIIFEAGLFANMEIVERHNHYWASSYAYAGEDATIDYPNLDLRMRNKTEYQMFMECRVEGTRLRVNIWGYQDPDYDNIRLHSENFNVTKTDFHTRTFRELFKNGEIIKTETICDSYYNIKNSIKTPDAETYRTTVNGYVQYEDAEYETMPENNTSDEEEENSDEESDDESSEEEDENSEEDNNADEESEEDNE